MKKHFILSLVITTFLNLNLQAKPLPPDGGIYSHQVFLATSQDSLTWVQDEKLLFDHASVPDAVIRPDGTIFLYFIDASGSHDKLSVAKSTDGKTWEKKTVEIEGLPEKKMAVDPNPVLLGDGSIRLFYFVPDNISGDPAFGEGDHKIYSAVSKDGLHFKQEEGIRFSHARITDPDVVKTKSGWVLFTSMGPSLLMATSSDGKTFASDETVVSQNGAVSRTISLGNGYRVFKCTQGTIYSQFTTDFKTWKEEGERIKGEPGMLVCDPGVIKLPDGTYKMFYKKAPMKKRN